MSNIKVFPMAKLPAWPFAPIKLQAARLKDSLNIVLE
jgi:hypothetical protein